jgi:hypothetical protein
LLACLRYRGLCQASKQYKREAKGRHTLLSVGQHENQERQSDGFSLSVLETFQSALTAEDRKSAEEEFKAFAEEFEDKYAKAVECVRDDLEQLMAFMQFPAQHWVHLRTTNPIESGFAPAKGRTKKTKGAGSRKAGLAMAFKLMEVAQSRWRRINAPQLIPLVVAGIPFPDGVQAHVQAVEVAESQQQRVAA